jgi:hypothetical protein
MAPLATMRPCLSERLPLQYQGLHESMDVLLNVELWTALVVSSSRSERSTCGLRSSAGQRDSSGEAPQRANNHGCHGLPRAFISKPLHITS